MYKVLWHFQGYNSKFLSKFKKKLMVKNWHNDVSEFTWPRSWFSNWKIEQSNFNLCLQILIDALTIFCDKSKTINKLLCVNFTSFQLEELLCLLNSKQNMFSKESFRGIPHQTGTNKRGLTPMFSENHEIWHRGSYCKDKKKNQIWAL